MLRRTTLLLLVLGLGLTGLLAAQLPGTLFGQFSDENGDPVAGVKITITNPEAPNFLQEEVSDERGRYSIFLRNSTVPYNLAFEKEGYEKFRMPGFKVPTRQRTRRNWVIKTAAAVQQIAVQALDAIAEDVEIKGSHVKIYNQGVLALEAGDIATARVLFEEALAKKDDFGPAYGGMARVHWKRKEWEDALRYAMKTLELDPEDTLINQVLYDSYSGLGQKAKAEEILKVLQAANPETAGLNLFNQAADLYNAGDTAGAKPLFERILVSDPDNPKANYMLGLCYISEGSNDLAKERLTHFLEIAPNDSDAPTAKEMLNYLD